MNKLTVLSMSLLAACSSAPTRVYTLPPVAPDRPVASYQGAPLHVASVNFPADLDRIEVVTDAGDGTLRINEFDHWAAPLGRLAQEALSADLVARLPPGKVAFPRLPAGAAVTELRVNILRIPTGNGVHLAARWQRSDDPHIATSGLIDFPDGSHSALDLAHGLSAMLARLADQIALTLSQTAEPTGP